MTDAWREVRARLAARGETAAFVIAHYNHPRTVASVVRAAAATGLDVWVVDDGSTDPGWVKGLEGSAEGPHEDRATGQAPRISVVMHRANLGKGAAIRTGMRAAAHDGVSWVVTVDADGQHDPADAAQLLSVALDAVSPRGPSRPALGHALAVATSEGLVQRETRPTLVVGRRQGMHDSRRVPWTSRFGRGFSNFWVFMAGGPRLSDTQSGFRVYPALATLGLPLRTSRFDFEVEVLVRAHRAGFSIREANVAVEYCPPGGRVSHFRPWRDFFRNAAIFARLIFLRIFGPRVRRSQLLP